MSLEQPIQTKKTKTARARELALTYKDLPYLEARTKIMEEIPCSRSTATKALKRLKKEQEKETAARPKIEVQDEKKKEPAFLREKPEPTELEEVETKPPAIKTGEMTEVEVQEQLDLFRDMLRGIYTMIFAKEGILGDRYGRTVKQCEQAADMLYRWLLRRYSVEELEKWDTILLVGAHATLIGGIVKDYVADRSKKK